MTTKKTPATKTKKPARKAPAKKVAAAKKTVRGTKRKPGSRGRKSTFTQTKADKICQLLATGEPLTHICKREGMPDPATVWNWQRSDEAFAQDIAHARELGHDAIADDCVDIADATNRPDADAQRDKLRVWTRLQLLAKWDPKRYGEKVGIEHSVDKGLGDLLRQRRERANAERD